jgi:hypothetical protein
VKRTLVYLSLVVIIFWIVFFSIQQKKVYINDDLFITVVAAGDIAANNGNQKITADVVNLLHPDIVLTLGDNAYENGSLSDFNNYYKPSWGNFKSITAPAPGNHEYQTRDAAGYFNYFGDLAGPKGKGYYSFDLGTWHIISLNSERINKEQTDWLAQDLKERKEKCILAYWHKPLFSSGEHGNDLSVKPFWDLLYSYGADLVLNGHDHDYERFAKQNPDGSKAEDGIREFVVGTGGSVERSFTHSVKNSEVTATSQYGVLELQLDNDSFDARFVPAKGYTFVDSVLKQKCNDQE